MKKHTSILISILLAFSLTACTGGEGGITSATAESESVASTASAESESIIPEPQSSDRETVATPQPPEETVAEEITPVTYPTRFAIVNLCGVDIGMISVLDPGTKEQIDLGELVAEKAMLLDLEWPVEEKELYIGIYNVDGDLVCSSAITIEQAFQNREADSQINININLSLNENEEVQFDVTFE